jgi:hypothetical protein
MSDIPIFGTGRTNDYLNIKSDDCNIEISNDTDSYSFSLGTVTYTSKNSYFVDQSYIYEAGALILSQSGASILHGKPFLSVINNSNISLTFINISGLDGKRFAGGYGTYSLYMEYLNSTSYLVDSFSFINITTNFPNSWRSIFNSSSLKYSSLSYEITDTVDGISIVYSGSLGNLILKVVEISAQIAPGWIE